MEGKYQDLQIISNRSADSLRNRVVDEFRKIAHPEPNGKEANATAKIFPSGDRYTRLTTNSRGGKIHLMASFHRPDWYRLKRLVANNGEMDLQDKGLILEEYMHTLASDVREANSLMDAIRRSGADELYFYPTYQSPDPSKPQIQ